MREDGQVSVFEMAETIPCGWCDEPVVVEDDHGQVVYCSEDHKKADTYTTEKAL